MSRIAEKTFIEQCLDGEAGPADVETYVERWHTGKDGRTLDQFLGMTPEEYAMWVENPDSLRFILLARSRGLELRKAV